MLPFYTPCKHPKTKGLNQRKSGLKFKMGTLAKNGLIDINLFAN